MKATDMPKVSIVTPSYNHARFLHDRVSSILAQTFDNFEWIIIDDCSTDNSREILIQLTAHDTRVKLFFNKKNLGMAATIEKAIKLSLGKYIYRAESDDVCHPTFLERMVEVLDNNPNVGFVFCSSMHIDNDGYLWGGGNQEKNDYIRHGMEVFKTLVLGDYIAGCNIVFSRKAHDSIGGFRIKPFEIACDWHFCLRLCFYYDVGYISDPLGYHRIHSDNLSSKLNKTFELNLFFREGYELLQNVFTFVPERYIRLRKLQNKAFRSLSLSKGASLYVKAILNGKWDIARQIKKGVEGYDPGATSNLLWIKACMKYIIFGGIYHYFYTPISRALNIRKRIFFD